MSPQFKKLYCQYIEKGITSSDIGKFRNELNNIPDEELWNTMIDMENDTVEIKMPPMMKKQIRKELQQIIWRRRWLQYMKYAAIIAIILSSFYGTHALPISICVPVIRSNSRLYLVIRFSSNTFSSIPTLSGL